MTDNMKQTNIPTIINYCISGFSMAQINYPSTLQILCCSPTARGISIMIVNIL